jgi:hypothetical protein
MCVKQQLAARYYLLFFVFTAPSPGITPGLFHFGDLTNMIPQYHPAFLRPAHRRYHRAAPASGTSAAYNEANDEDQHRDPYPEPAAKLAAVNTLLLFHITSVF